MILTDEGIYFSRPESNMIVDKISIHDIVSVGRVDNLDKKSFETKRSSNIEPFGNILPQRQRRGSSLNKQEFLESLQEGQKESYAIEIKACSGMFYRSHFVRVLNVDDCEDWILQIDRAIRKSRSDSRVQGTQLQQIQQSARHLYDNHYFRCVIATAILLDFLSSVFESEFLQVTDPSALKLFRTVDIMLCAFFLLELCVNLVGNWCSLRGTPFVLRASNWFLLATVFFQLSGYVLPQLDAQHLKVIRVIRLFDVGRAFRSLASCQMVLKALRHGDPYRPAGPSLRLHVFESMYTVLFTSDDDPLAGPSRVHTESRIPSTLYLLQNRSACPGVIHPHHPLPRHLHLRRHLRPPLRRARPPKLWSVGA